VPARETLEGQFGLMIIATLSARVSEKSSQRVPSGAQDVGGGSLVRLRGQAVGHGISISRDGHPVPMIRRSVRGSEPSVHRAEGWLTRLGADPGACAEDQCGGQDRIRKNPHTRSAQPFALERRTRLAGLHSSSPLRLRTPFRLAGPSP
jgi:hypothetical protein